MLEKVFVMAWNGVLENKEYFLHKLGVAGEEWGFVGGISGEGLSKVNWRDRTRNEDRFYVDHAGLY